MQPHLHQHCKIAREGVRAHPFALDDPRIAERGLKPRLALVHQQDGPPPPREVNGGGNPDDAGAENYHIVFHACPYRAVPPVAAAFSSSHHQISGKPMA